MTEGVEVMLGPDGAGRPGLPPEALERLCACYSLLATWAAHQRRRQQAQDEAAKREGISDV